jgi:hypothetical protein
MNVGDRVRLLQNVGPCLAGSEGVVTFVDNHGNVATQIDRNPSCAPVVFLLPPVPANYFSTQTQCPP